MFCFLVLEQYLSCLWQFWFARKNVHTLFSRLRYFNLGTCAYHCVHESTYSTCVRVTHLAGPSPSLRLKSHNNEVIHLSSKSLLLAAVEGRALRDLGHHMAFNFCICLYELYLKCKKGKLHSCQCTAA